MDMMLTAFGLSHLGAREENPFYRLPAHILSIANRELMPDFSMLLLCDRLLIDKDSFERLMRIEERDKWAYSQIYARTSDLIKLLHEEGFVRLEDFQAIIDSSRPLLEKMLETEVKSLDQWVAPMKESVTSWRESFDTLLQTSWDQDDSEAGLADEVRNSYGYLQCCYMHGLCYLGRREFIDEALRSSVARRRPMYRQALQAIVKEYLAYINANLVLSQHFNCGFHDWADMRPFYDLKFLRVGQWQQQAQRETDKLRSLFSVSFPEFAFWTPEAVVRALRDKRVVALREMVKEAIANNIPFDHEFANRIFREVLEVERGLGRLRNIVSYLTMPLGFIPVVGTPVQKAMEEAIIWPLSKSRKQQFQWFYLISETTGKQQETRSE